MKQKGIKDGIKIGEHVSGEAYFHMDVEFNVYEQKTFYTHLIRGQKYYPMLNDWESVNYVKTGNRERRFAIYEVSKDSDFDVKRDVQKYIMLCRTPSVSITNGLEINVILTC